MALSTSTLQTSGITLAYDDFHPRTILLLVMQILKRFVRFCYYALKYLFYPLVLILMLVIPAVKPHPQFIVGTYTMFFFGFLANFVWRNTSAGIILFGLMQITGIGLAILFMIWGAEFEKKPSFRKREAWNSTDSKILLCTVPLVLLALVAGRMEGLDQSDFAYTGLIVITFVCVIARRYYVLIDLATILVGIIWLFGFLVFYASLWFPALNVEVLRKLAGVGFIGILGYVFYDYGRLKKWSIHAAVPKGIVFISIILYLLLFNIFGYRIPNRQLDLLVQPAVFLTILGIAMSYWSHLSGKPVRWPWQRRDNVNESDKGTG